MPDTEPRDAERLKAFDLFLQSNQQGKPRSLRSIAATLGVAPTTIQRWRDVDQWDAKVNETLAGVAQAAETTQNALKRRVRRGLLDGLSELQRIATKGTREADRIAAVRAIAEIAIKLDAVNAAAGGTSAIEQQYDFKDDLPNGIELLPEQLGELQGGSAPSEDGAPEASAVSEGD